MGSRGIKSPKAPRRASQGQDIGQLFELLCRDRVRETCRLRHLTPADRLLEQADRANNPTELPTLYVRASSRIRR